jgi:hypothetical protein
LIRLSQMGVVVIVGAMLLSACAGGGGIAEDSTTTVVVPAVTTTGVVTTTTAAASTTSESTTTIAVTTTTVSAEELVAQVHTRVFTELFARDERVDGPEAHLPLAEELTTGPLLERIRLRSSENLADGGRSVGPGYDSNIVEVVVTGDSATVLDCSRDAGEGYSSSGELMVPADDFFKLRQSILILLDGSWVVEDIYVGGDQRCDPADYQ